jgi:hypothetical protein
MANLNALIAQGYQFQPPVNPFVQYGQMQQLEQGQQTNELNRMKMQEFQRGMEETNALRRLDPESPTYLQDVTRISPEKGFAFAKSQQEAKTARTEGQTKEVKLLTDKLSLLPQAYQMADTPEAYLALHQSVHADPVLGPWLKSTGATPEKGLATLQNAIQTGKFDDLRLKSMQSVSQLLDSMKPISVAASSSVYDPKTGTFIQAPAAPDKDKVTDLMANYKAAQAQGFTGSIFDYERKLNESRRTPRPEAAPRTQQVTLSDGTLGIVNMDTGVITRSTVEGASVKGKPSAFAEKAAAQKTQMGKDLGFAITQLADITKDGGLIDQSTGSGAGKLIDLGAGFVGKATPGAIAIGKIAPVADLALKMIPRFEGPQSNADTKSYKEASGQLADSSLPTEIRKQAGKVVLRLMKERQNQFVTSDMAAEGVTAAQPTQNVRSQADAILNGSN